jgi:hypothetical protein
METHTEATTGTVEMAETEADSVKLNFIRSFIRSLCYITATFGHLSLSLSMYPPFIRNFGEIATDKTHLISGFGGVRW